jgi:hypothetical protein
VTMVEAEGGVRWRRGCHRLVGWRFNAGDNNTVSKLGFKFFGGGGGNISNHRSFEGGRRTGDRLAVRGCSEATRRVGLERREKGEAVIRKPD